MSKLIFGMALALSLGAAQSSFACSCAAVGAPRAELAKSSAVFSGKVLNIRNLDRQHVLVTFEVDHVWKGVRARNMSVTTWIGGATCGYPFSQSDQFLVYASTMPGSSNLQTSICTRTRPVKDAAEDLAALGEGVRP